MGTSSSYGGPGDKTPLLPSWAMPPDGTPQTPEQPTQPTPNDGPGTDTPPAENAPSDLPHQSVSAPEVTNRWTSARRSFTRAISTRTSTGYRRAASRYVRAIGGAGGASNAATGGKKATTAFGGFISSAANSGFHSALASVGLTSVVGRDVNEVLAAIVNALAPDGATKEEVAARKAIGDTLEQLYESFLDEGRDLTALDSMTREDVEAAIASCVEAYIFNRWIGDLGVKIEERAISAASAVVLEREMRLFIREAVQLDMGQEDVLSLDWQGPDGQRFVENIYCDAYSLFGDEA